MLKLNHKVKERNATWLLNLADKILFTLLFLFLPTQLAYHSWFPFSFVFGIRVDYLALAIYLTDIILIFYLLFKFLTNKTKLTKKPTLILIFILAINILFSIQTEISLIRSFKLLEFFLLIIVISKEQKENIKKIPALLTLSLLPVTLLSFLQLVSSKTLGGIWYLLGERSFTIDTPGIALQNIFGYEILRPYSTFSHPNSLAGFCGVVFLLLLSTKRKSPLIKLGLILSLSQIILSFSENAILTFLFVLSLFFIQKLKTNIRKISFLVLIVSLFLSLLMPVVAINLANSNLIIKKEINERVELTYISGKVITNNFIFGSGLNTFILNLPNYANETKNTRTIWLLQPVHNIFLLIFSELGLFGLMLAFIFLSKSIYKAKTKYLFAFIFILLTGLLDHYSLTLQQNTLLFAIVLGLSLR